MPRSMKPEFIFIAKLVLDLVKTGTGIFDDDIFLTSARDLFLYLAIYIGHAEKRPMSAGKISQYIGMPRATVIRRLDDMNERGLIKKTPSGGWYVALDEGQNRAKLIKMFEDNLQHIHSTAQRLSNMDR